MEPDGKTYVITKDLVPTLQNRLGIPMPISLAESINRLENEFLEGFWGFVNVEAQHEVLDSAELVEVVRGKLENEKRPIICFDDVYFPWIREGRFSITRLTNPLDSSKYVFGPRPGFPSLDEQIANLRGLYGDGEVAILDIGAFSADSLIEPLFDFQKAGLKPVTIYLGLAGINAAEKLKKHGLSVSVAHSYQFDDWIELRDFFGIDGRKVDQTKVDFNGIENMAGKNLFIPYRENPGEWASIVGDKQEDFRRFCDKYSEQLMSLVRDSGTNIKLKEVTRGKFGIFYLDVGEK